MYEIPCFGHHFFHGEALGVQAVIAIGSIGIKIYHEEDIMRETEIGKYGYNEIESFTCNSEVGFDMASLSESST